MEILWFSIVAFMITMYVILDGFDLGAGIIHLFAAKTDTERRAVLNAIGPVWDGNEVWLLAAGGTLYFAFPLLYASSFSGFYLPLMIVLWLFIMRALGIEFRHQLHHPLWKSFWDVAFSAGSVLLSIFLGAALGNVIRGVPLQEDGYFFAPLWTTFTVQPDAGILDWFTVIMGLVGLFTLTVHGSNFIALKTLGNLQKRARTAARVAWWGTLLTSIAALVSVHAIRPEVWVNYAHHPWGWVFPLTGAAGLAGSLLFNTKGDDLRAFLGSALFITGMLGATAFGLYPNVLPSSGDPARNLTVSNTITQEYGLSVGLIWWTIGILIASGYFIYLFRSFRGKVVVPAESEGY
ncbi:MAG: cytochrome bd quinol oxidase subunit 2 apoprotein [Bacteroidetes bacterium]|nr:cytochrome bd quinol oxidase subunit 2 apoprotein [Bacteroidota bacterium]